MLKSISELQSLVQESILQQNLMLEPKELYEPIGYALESGGKRLRPLLVLLGCQVYSDEVNKAIRPALGIEMFHNFTLLHDDIMDKAFMRRNKPTVHIKWNINRAILSGDALAIQSNILVSSCDRSILPEVLDVFNTTALQVCEGQQYDLNFEIVDHVTEEEYMHMISLKTAVLLAGSLKIGALIGGSGDDEAHKMYDFGYQMGMAFQLQDDFLDSFGNAETFGKSIGGDILANKKTVLWIKAMERANESQLKELKHWFSITEVSKPFEKITEVVKIFRALKVDEYTRDLVIKYSNSALALLGEIKADKERTEELRNFTNKLINRVS